jgi:short-subunit dehydrogenase
MDSNMIVTQKYIIIGGSNGIGLAIAIHLAKVVESCVLIIDRIQPDVELPPNITYEYGNLLDCDLSFLEAHNDADGVIFTAGFGRVAPFETIVETEVYNQFQVNAISPINVLRYFYPRMREDKPFYCAVMGSIAGIVSSPLFALYSATKAAVCKAIEAINIELEMTGSPNRVLNVSPGSIKGTSFNNGQTDLSVLEELGKTILLEMEKKSDLYIPQYDTIYKEVLQRYHEDFRKEGCHSYDYKLNSGRVNTK